MRRKKHYFEMDENAPEPIRTTIRRRLRFSDADPLGIAWHGRYPAFFEEAQTELGHLCGLTYDAYKKNGIAAPIAQLHIDYFQPIHLDDFFTVTASLLWSDGARLNTEYEMRTENNELICSGYTVQLFVDLDTREPLFCNPELWENCRNLWRKGAFHA